MCFPIGPLKQRMRGALMFDFAARDAIEPASAPRTLAQSQILVHESGDTRLERADDFADIVRDNDCVIFNDSATMPASLFVQTRRGENIELRLYRAIDSAAHTFHCMVFGDGDFRIRTEQRPRPPHLNVGDELLVRGNHDVVLRVTALEGRIASLQVASNHSALDVFYRHGHAIQYSYVPQTIDLWDVQNPFATRPWSVENPSAGRVLDHANLRALRARGVEVAPLTHAAGLSTTGVNELDQTLPWIERYEVPACTAEVVRRTRARGGRVIALGTSTVRALESAARGPLAGTTNLRIDGNHALAWVDAIVTGVHASGSSHADLLRAFISSRTQDHLLDVSRTAEMRAHEFGDFWFVECEICEG